MGEFEDRLEELQKRVLGSKQNNQDNESILVFDAETDNSVIVDINLNEITDDRELEFFFDDKVRKIWHKQEEEWYFSVVDVCAVLTDQENARSASTYWAVVKNRLKEDGADELLTNCKQLKMKASDGKMRKTDCASTEQLLRIIQSIPSKKAEPFKQWLALVGKERLDEIADPELAFERMIDTYRKKGYSEKWIEQRLHAIDVRKLLTDEWKRAGIKDTREYATLTNVLTNHGPERQSKNIKHTKVYTKRILETI